jgi:hypothetical protein
MPFFHGTYMDLYKALGEDGGIDLLKAYFSPLWPLDISGSSALQEIYIEILIGEAIVGYYLRRRDQVGPPDIEPCLKGSGSEIWSERECRVADYQTRPEAQNNSDMVEGIWGYIFTY